MKKFIIFISVYAMFLCIPIEAKENDVTYKIYMDSTSNNAYEIKEEVLSIYAYLCEGVDNDSCNNIIKEKQSLFNKIENSKIRFKNNTLIVQIGDAKGSLIEGKYKKENICFEEVKPKSKILEMLGINK